VGGAGLEPATSCFSRGAIVWHAADGPKPDAASLTPKDAQAQLRRLLEHEAARRPTPRTELVALRCRDIDFPGQAIRVRANYSFGELASLLRTVRFATGLPSAEMLGDVAGDGIEVFAVDPYVDDHHIVVSSECLVDLLEPVGALDPVARGAHR
jgi:hypothetical protein